MYPLQIKRRRGERKSLKVETLFQLILFNRHFALLLRPASIKLWMTIHDAPGNDCCHRRAAHRQAIERCVAALRFRARHVELPAQVWVKYRHIAPRAGAERAAI